MPRGKKKTSGRSGGRDLPPEDDAPAKAEEEDGWETSYATEDLSLDRPGADGPEEFDAGEPETALAADLQYSGLTAADVMVSDVITVRLETTMEEVSELFQIHNINGAPVVDEDGLLVGIVTEDDVVVGGMGFSDEELDTLDGDEGETAGKAPAAGPTAAAAGEGEAVGETRRVAEIMTPRPITVEEDTPVEELCRLMWKLKIHRIPIVSQGRVRGIVSTIDICRLVAEGRARLVPVD
jgi:CBS domain-containing protein